MIELSRRLDCALTRQTTRIILLLYHHSIRSLIFRSCLPCHLDLFSMKISRQTSNWYNCFLHFANASSIHYHSCYCCWTCPEKSFQFMFINTFHRDTAHGELQSETGIMNPKTNQIDGNTQTIIHLKGEKNVYNGMMKCSECRRLLNVVVVVVCWNRQTHHSRMVLAKWEGKIQNDFICDIVNIIWNNTNDWLARQRDSIEFA